MRPNYTLSDSFPESSTAAVGRVETLGEVGLAASQVRVSVRPGAVIQTFHMKAASRSRLRTLPAGMT